MKKRGLALLVMAILASSVAFASGQGEQSTGKTGGEDTRVPLAFVTNGPYTFWTYANAGIIQAEKEYPVKVEFFKPPNSSVEEQKRFIETMMAKGVKGLGISVIDPVNETPMLNEIAQQIPVVTFDSDAPDSGRSAYVGMSNYAAGRLQGKEIIDAMPNGGTIVLTVGHLDAQNAVERIQAIIDELDGKPYAAQYPGGIPKAGKTVAGKWTILDIRSDGGDESKAKAEAEDALVRFPDLGMLGGIWSYNTPAILSALESSNKLGKVKVVGFDEEVVTLKGIEDGYVHNTIVQNPFEYGRKTIELLYKLATKQDAGIPQNKLVDVPARVIKKEQVASYMETLNKQLAVGEFFEVK